jgi:probable HAF family extracellular repeat protein
MEGLGITAIKKTQVRQELVRLQAKKTVTGERRGTPGGRRIVAWMLESVRRFMGSRVVRLGLLVIGSLSLPSSHCFGQSYSPYAGNGRLDEGYQVGVIVGAGQVAEDSNYPAMFASVWIRALGGNNALVSIPLQDPNYPGSIGAGTNCRFDGGNYWFVGWQDKGGDSSYHAVRVKARGDLTDIGTVTDLGTLGGLFSFATDVSSDGSVVVGFSDNGLDANARRHAFSWTETGGMVDLGSGNGPDGTSHAYGVSGDGSIVVGVSDFAVNDPNSLFPVVTSDAFLWTANNGFQQLVGGGGAYAVTTDGSVVVGGPDSNGNAFLWTQAGGMQELGTLPGTVSAPGIVGTAATGVSDDGQVVVGTAGVYPLLNFVGWNFTPFGYDLNSRPFVWTAATGMQDLNDILANAGVDLTGITLLGLTGVSTDGQYVCGVARTPQNDPNDPYDFSAFIAQLPP